MSYFQIDGGKKPVVGLTYHEKLVKHYVSGKLGWFKYAKNANIKNHHRSTVAMVRNDGPGVVKLDPASTQLEQEPFQHLGVGQHHLQALGVIFGFEIEN